jgi:hypothetical protein
MVYTVKCKELFLNGIRPSNPLSYQKKEYIELMNIANQEIKEIGVDLFSSNFQEMQYLVNLWTAHILFERKDVSCETKKDCLSIIRDYSTTPVDIVLAKEEENWLRERGLPICKI